MFSGSTVQQIYVLCLGTPQPLDDALKQRLSFSFVRYGNMTIGMGMLQERAVVIGSMLTMKKLQTSASSAKVYDTGRNRDYQKRNKCLVRMYA